MSNPGVAGEGQDKSDQQYHWELWQQRRRRRKTPSKKAIGFTSKTATLHVHYTSWHISWLSDWLWPEIFSCDFSWWASTESNKFSFNFLSFYRNLTKWVSWNNLDEVQRTRIHLTSVSGFNSLVTYSAISTSGYTVMSWIHPVNCGSEFSPFPTL